VVVEVEEEEEEEEEKKKKKKYATIISLMSTYAFSSPFSNTSILQTDR
jgi:hypothetical protein